MNEELKKIIDGYFIDKETFYGKIKHILKNLEHKKMVPDFFCSREASGAGNKDCNFFTTETRNTCHKCIFYKSAKTYKTFLENTAKVLSFSSEGTLYHKMRYTLNILEYSLITSILIDYTIARGEYFLHCSSIRDCVSEFRRLGISINNYLSDKYMNMVNIFYEGNLKNYKENQKEIIKTFLTACLEILEELK